MKKTMIWGLAALMGVLTSCGGNNASDTKLHVIFDNPAPRTMGLALFGEVPEAIVSKLGIAEGVPSSVSVMLLEKDGQQVLFDAGNGNNDSRLIPALKELGFEAKDIDAILITHLHGDHIGGLTKDGARVFQQAKLYVAAAELDAWTKTAESTPANVKVMMDAYGADVVKFDAGDKLPVGIEAMAAPGHTPGHTVYRTGDKLIVGDIMHGVALQMEHPEFCARFDMDKEQAIAARKKTMDLAKKEGWTVYGMHFPTKEGMKLK